MSVMAFKTVKWPFFSHCIYFLSFALFTFDVKGFSCFASSLNIAVQRKLELTQRLHECTLSDLTDLKAEVSKYLSDKEEKFKELTVASCSIRKHFEDLDTKYQRDKKYVARKLSDLAYQVELEVKGAKRNIRDMDKQFHIYEEKNMKVQREKHLSMPCDISRSGSSDMGQIEAPLQQVNKQASVERPVTPAANCAWPPAQCVENETSEVHDKKKSGHMKVVKGRWDLCRV
jgi:hypothetical protein